jgi:hypothetical protein
MRKIIQLTTVHGRHDVRIEYDLKKPGISRDEFKQIVTAPPRLFPDYPNNDALWRCFL